MTFSLSEDSRAGRPWRRRKTALALASATILVRKGTTLANLSGIVKQLKKERDRVQQQLSGLNAALEAFAGVYRGQNGTKTTEEDVSQRTRPDRSRSESTVGQ
jgi:hypothetical protein